MCQLWTWTLESRILQQFIVLLTICSLERMGSALLEGFVVTIFMYVILLFFIIVFGYGMFMTR